METAPARNGFAVKRSLMLLMMASVLLAAARPAATHPLGNFTISHYTAIRLAHDRVELNYLVDMAEIPTFQEIQESGIVAEDGHPSLGAYLARKAESLKERLLLQINGRRLALQTLSREVIFPPGAGGLPTLKLKIRYRAQIDTAGRAGANDLHYRDGNFPDRAGWKEVIAVVEKGLPLLSSSVPDKDRSDELANYPTDLLNSPPQDIEARVAFMWKPPAIASREPVAPPANLSARLTPVAPSLQANRQTTPRSAFTELVTRKQLGFGMVIMALAVAVALGALHALEPGHGKTVVAAYLVGSRGTAWHAVALGLIVTASHTAGVYVLGGVTFYASQYIVPESLYPWIGFGSGLTVAALGVLLFVRRYKGTSGSHSEHHQHHGHHHSHSSPLDAGHGFHDHAAHAREAAVSLRELFALGITGGMIPCPAALVVLLSALSLRRVGFGLLLIVAFSVGLAVVLVAIGILIVHARRFMARFQGDGPLMTRWLPLASSAVVTFLGIAIAIQALAGAGILRLGLS